jgi:hypothetical protein
VLKSETELPPQFLRVFGQFTAVLRRVHLTPHVCAEGKVKSKASRPGPFSAPWRLPAFHEMLGVQSPNADTGADDLPELIN